MRILLLSVLAIGLCGCAGKPPPAAPLIRQEYPTAKRPFVYDIARPGCLICGGRDGKQELPLKLPSDHSAVLFNFDAGLLLVLCARDNTLFRRSAYIYDANAKCLAFSVLERNPVPGENVYRLWLADRPEAVIFLAEGFKKDRDPAFQGHDPETYYLLPEQPAKRLGIPCPLAVCFTRTPGFIVLHRGQDRKELEARRYSPEKLVWTCALDPKLETGRPRLVADDRPGIEAVLSFGEKRLYFTDQGQLLTDLPSVEQQ